MSPLIWLDKNGYLKGKVLWYNSGYGTDADYIKGEVQLYDRWYHTTKLESKYDTIVHDGEFCSRAARTHIYVGYVPAGWFIMVNGKVVKRFYLTLWFGFSMFVLVAVLICTLCFYIGGVL